jgi:serine/threonine protein kinase
MNKEKDIQDYKIELSKLLGFGKYGFFIINIGKVYRGYRTEDKKTVAIKVISTKTFDKKLLKSLEFEWKTLSNLKSDYIVKVFDVRKSKNRIYMIMEHCNGGDLSTYMKNHKTISEDKVKLFLHDLINGLKYLKYKFI